MLDFEIPFKPNIPIAVKSSASQSLSFVEFHPTTPISHRPLRRKKMKQQANIAAENR
jgi:hypothetical protein